MKSLPNFFNHWQIVLGQLLAQVSDRITGLGLIWVVTDQFGAQAVTWYLVAGGLPHLIFSFLSAQLIRRLGVLNTVIGADYARAFIYFMAALLFHKIENNQDLAGIFMLIFIANVFTAFFNPAILTLPLHLAEGKEVQQLTARLSTVTSLVTVVGPLIGLFCYQALGIRGLFFITSFAYFGSGLLAWTMRKFILKKNEDPTEPDAHRQWNFRETLGHFPLVTTMLGVFLFMNLFLSPLQVQMPYLAKNIFEGSFNALAGMEMALGLGIVLGGLGLSLYSIRKRELLWTWIFLIGLSLFFLGFQRQSSFILAMGSLTVMGLFVGLSNILIINIFQSYPPVGHVPNIMAMVNLISVAAVPLSLIGVGALQTWYSLPQIGLVCAFLLIGVSLLSYFPFQRWGKELFK